MGAIRFILIEHLSDFPDDGKTCWYWDIARQIDTFDSGQPIDKSNQPYIAVQCYKDRNPNKYIKHNRLMILYTDQAEYYFVCSNCYYANITKQWSGNTRMPDYRAMSLIELKKHTEEKGWCEFCDPCFGSGGWL